MFVGAGGFITSLIATIRLYLERTDQRSRVRKDDAARRRKFEGESQRVYDEYVDMLQAIVLAVDFWENEPVAAKTILLEASKHEKLPDPTRHLYDDDEHA